MELIFHVWRVNSAMKRIKKGAETQRDGSRGDLSDSVSFVQSPGGSEGGRGHFLRWPCGGASVAAVGRAEARAALPEVGEVARADHVECGCVPGKLLAH